MTADQRVRTVQPSKRSKKTRETRPLPPPSLRPKPISRVITTVVLVFVAIYFLGPIYWLIVASSKTKGDMVASNPLLFTDHPLGGWAANWDALLGWTGGNFPRWVLNSLLYSGIAGVVGTLISVMCGFAIAKYTFPGRRALLAVTMTGLLMPVALLTIPMYVLFHSLGIVNTPLAVIIPCMISPFGVFLGQVYATSSVPTELLEAARVDGSSEARTFFTMVLRLLAPAMLTIFLFIFVATWNNILLPLMMISSPELKPVTLGLYGMNSYFDPNKGAMMLGALMGVLPLIVLFLALQRYWRSGLAAGAVKG
ncbi:MAG: carbohydrate ABC transporter permease [Propionibacteriaceae bacterium]|jgi:multiple sugar transport system permease protein|nr:carbohydrate ABC transporter permease [Propionibacteriaceae bacterium]